MKNMKNTLLALGMAALTLVLGMALTACDSSGVDKEYTVTFYAGDGNPSIQTRTVTSGGSIGASMPSNPSKSDHTFDGWYTSQNGGGESFSGTTKVTADISVYAKWTANSKTEGVIYELTRNPDYDNYICNNSNDFLPSGFAVNAGERITVSLSIKTDTAMTGFYIGIGDWNNGNHYDDSNDAWIAPGWEESKSVPADGQFHSYTWTLTAKSAAPAGSNPLVFHFAMDSVSKSKVAISVKDVSVVIAKRIEMPSNLSLAESLTWIANNAVEGGVYAVTLTKNESIEPKTLSYNGKNVSVALDGGASERTVSLSSTGPLFTVGNGVVLMLDGNIALQGLNGNTDPLIQVSSGGTLVTNVGSKISGNGNASGAGGGVYIAGGGRFGMNGGTVSGNSASRAGGVYVNGVFVMNGGVISGNSASGSQGGGVYVTSTGTFAKQSGGTIYGSNASDALKNTASSDSYGQAVYVNSSPAKIRNATAGNGVTLDSAKDGTAGGWADGGGAQYAVLTYDANGASGTPPPSQTVSAGSEVTVAGQGSLTYSGKTFNGWNAISAGTGTLYSAGASLAVNADMTLYAQWISNSALAWEHVSELPNDLSMNWDITGYGYHHASVMNGNIVITYVDGALASSDGVNWSRNSVLPAASDGYYDVERNQHILFNNKLYSIGGYHYTTADDYYAVDSLITESSNLSSWTVTTGVTGLTDGIVNHVGLAFKNAMWVISGTTESLFDDWLVTDIVWKSTDGVNWVEQNATGLTPRGEAAGVVYNGKIYITGGYMDGGQDELNDVVASSDGITWTTLTTNPGWRDRNGHTLVANSQGMWLIGGNGGDNAEFFNDVWFSSDGVNWTNKGDAPFAPRAGHASVVKDGYLYVMGGITGDDWETSLYLSDVWRAYIGGTDLDASSYFIEPATLTITNNNSYPLKFLSINDSGSNELSSNLDAGASWQKQFDPGTYSFTVHDTQDRDQSFSVTIGTASQTKIIGTTGWTTPPVVIPEYTLTIKNNYGQAISGVFVRKSGTSDWGSNKISGSGLGGTIATNGSFSLTLESGQYEINLISQKSIGMSSGGVTGGATTHRPGLPGKIHEQYTKVYYYTTKNLIKDERVDAPSPVSNWSTVNK
ncbi:MAG: InlB B-repeat-containing protein [Treponema sp.]|jgi:uncharacterized repeat protein (TIGR02543 family)|nr:InlB B-repeat-containing protein [Treponema sp.]